jgi:hypothetical protein
MLPSLRYSGRGSGIGIGIGIGIGRIVVGAVVVVVVGGGPVGVVVVVVVGVVVVVVVGGDFPVVVVVVVGDDFLIVVVVVATVVAVGREGVVVVVGSVAVGSSTAGADVGATVALVSGVPKASSNLSADDECTDDALGLGNALLEDDFAGVEAGVVVGAAAFVAVDELCPPSGGNVSLSTNPT